MLRILVEDTAAQQIPEEMLVPPAPAEGKDNPKGGIILPKRNSMHSPRESRPMPPPPIRTTTPMLEESVRATLSPIGAGPSPRASTEISRASSDAYRRSMDLKAFGRRSVDLSRLNMDDTGRRSLSASRSLSRNRLDEEPRPSEKQGSSDSYVHSLEEPGSSGALPSASDETQASASQILRGSDVFLSPTIQRTSSASKVREPDSLMSNDSRSDSPSRDTVNLASHRQKLRHPATTGSMDGSNLEQAEASASAPTLQTLVKAGAYPMQRAGGFAGY